MKKGYGYFIVILGVMLSGNPAFVIISRQVDLSIIAIAFMVTFLVRRVSLTKDIIIVSFLFMLIFLIQSIRDGTFLLYTELGFLITIFVAYSVQLLIKDFPKYYVNVIFYLGIISLLFYIPAQVGNSIGIDFKSNFQWLRADLGEYYFHIYIHNFRIISSLYAHNEEWRNAGVFWEPGAFSGYLLLALIFLPYTRECFSQSQFRRRLILLTVCLATTFSTSGYLIYPLIFFVFILPVLSNTRVGNIKIWALSLFIFIASIPFLLQLPFIHSKITTEIESTITQEHGYGISRIGGFLFDYNFIKEKAVVGWGPDPTIRKNFSLVDDELFTRQGNGLTGFIVKFGVLGIYIYFWFVFQSFSNIARTSFQSKMFVLTIALILVNEQYLNYPIFLSLLFLRTWESGKYSTGKQYESIKYNDERNN